MALYRNTQKEGRFRGSNVKNPLFWVPWVNTRFHVGNSFSRENTPVFTNLGSRLIPYRFQKTREGFFTLPSGYSGGHEFGGLGRPDG